MNLNLSGILKSLIEVTLRIFAVIGNNIISSENKVFFNIKQLSKRNVVNVYV